MELTVIRHLPTEWNKLGLLQGKRDLSISKVTGDYCEQIAANMQKLEQFAPFDCILTSALKRTIETASLYGYTDIETESLANELDFGQYEGMPKKQLTSDHERIWLKNPIQLELGEKLVEFENRILVFLDKYSYYTNVLLFGHGSWIRALFSIKECGTIANMNQMIVPNNELLRFSFSKRELTELQKRRLF